MNQKIKGDIGEDFVNQVAFSSFLRYWCYPSPKDELGDKKEICDLLILFNEVVIIISVKNYEFKGQYERYFRNTTDKALSQIHGAERKLFGNQQLWIKHPDKDIELFIKGNFTKVYRIIVNLGDGLKFYNPSHYTKVGKHVTIMERSSWEGILQELDTISDFTQYLDAREELFKSRPVLMLPGKEHEFDQMTGVQFMQYAMNLSSNQHGQVIISGTENDLLAQYIINQKNYPEKFKSDKFQGLMLQIDGQWDEFRQRPEVIEKKERDKASYFIDEFVKREILKTNQGEIIAKRLMGLSRFDRRIVSNSFFTFVQKYAERSNKRFFARGYNEIDNKAFIFAYYSPDIVTEHVQTLCSLAMDSFAVYTKYRVKEFILIATTEKMKQFKFGYSKFDFAFPEEDERKILEDAKKLGWFQNLELGRTNDWEYK